EFEDFIVIRVIRRPGLFVFLEQLIDREEIEIPLENIMGESGGCSGMDIQTVRMCRPWHFTETVIAEHEGHREIGDGRKLTVRKALHDEFQLGRSRVAVDIELEPFEIARDKAVHGRLLPWARVIMRTE